MKPWMFSCKVTLKRPSKKERASVLAINWYSEELRGEGSFWASIAGCMGKPAYCTEILEALRDGLGGDDSPWEIGKIWAQELLYVAQCYSSLVRDSLNPQGTTPRSPQDMHRGFNLLAQGKRITENDTIYRLPEPFEVFDLTGYHSITYIGTSLGKLFGAQERRHFRSVPVEDTRLLQREAESWYYRYRENIRRHKPRTISDEYLQRSGWSRFWSDLRYGLTATEKLSRWRVCGPFQMEELKDLVQRWEVYPTDHVRHSDWDKWIPAKETAFDLEFEKRNLGSELGKANRVLRRLDGSSPWALARRYVLPGQWTSLTSRLYEIRNKANHLKVMLVSTGVFLTESRQKQYPFTPPHQVINELSREITEYNRLVDQLHRLRLASLKDIILFEMGCFPSPDDLPRRLDNAKVIDLVNRTARDRG